MRSFKEKQFSQIHPIKFIEQTILQTPYIFAAKKNGDVQCWFASFYSAIGKEFHQRPFGK